MYDCYYLFALACVSCCLGARCEDDEDDDVRGNGLGLLHQMTW